MAGDDVGIAPEPTQGRHGDDEQPTWREGAKAFCHEIRRMLQMLENVEAADRRERIGGQLEHLELAADDRIDTAAPRVARAWQHWFDGHGFIATGLQIA